MDDPRTVEIFVTSKYPAAGKSSLACTIAFLLKEHGFNAILKEGGRPHFGVPWPRDDRPVLISEMLTGETPNVKVTGAARLYRAASVWTAGLALHEL